MKIEIDFLKEGKKFLIILKAKYFNRKTDTRNKN